MSIKSFQLGMDFGTASNRLKRMVVFNLLERLGEIKSGDNAWCSSHKQFMPVEKFTKTKARWSGVHNQCKDCRGKNERGKYPSGEEAVC